MMVILGYLAALGLYILVYWIGFKHGNLMSQITMDMQSNRIEMLERDIEVLKLKNKKVSKRKSW